MARDTDQFSDVEIVAKTIYGEIRGGDYDAKASVAAVIMNRATKPGWWGGPDPRSVCLKPYQFSCWLPSDPNRQLLIHTPPNDPNYATCLAIAAKAVAGNLKDPTGGANSYYAASMEEPPDWAESLTPLCEIGDQVFFRI